MEATLVTYVRGGVGEAVSLLSEGCREYGFSAWTLDGRPASQPQARPSFTTRIAILALETRSWKQAQPQDLVGLAYVMRVDGRKSRITIQHENFSGKALLEASTPRLQDFCLWFIHFLEAKGARLQGADGETEAKPSPAPDESPSDKRPIPSRAN